MAGRPSRIDLTELALRWLEDRSQLLFLSGNLTVELFLAGTNVCGLRRLGIDLLQVRGE